MPLTSYIIYVLHCALLGVSLSLLRRWHVSGRLAEMSPRLLWVLALLVFGLELLMAEPLRSPFQDFYEAYYSGAKAVVSGANVTDAFEQGVHGFVNMPIVAVLLAPLAVLPKHAAGGLFFLVGAYVCYLAWLELTRLGRLDRFASGVLAILFLTNGPLFNSLKEGNTSHFALYALAVCWALLERGSPIRAGAVLAFVTLFKLPLLIYAGWALLRGKVRAFLAGAFVLIGLVVSSIALFGFPAHVEWYSSFVAGASKTPIGAFNVQSFAATALRFTFESPVVCDWNGHALSLTGQRLAMAFNAALVLAVLVPALVRARDPRVQRGPEEAREFALVALLACCTSPLAWSHYHVWLLLAVSYFLSKPWAFDFRGTPVVPCFWIGVFLSSLPVVWPWCEPSGLLGGAYLLFVSHHLLGTTLSLGALAFAPSTRLER